MMKILQVLLQAIAITVSGGWVQTLALARRFKRI